MVRAAPLGALAGNAVCIRKSVLFSAPACVLAAYMLR